MKKTIFSTICILFSFCTFAQIESVSVDEFEKQLINSKGEQLIDVRTPQEYERYRIIGAKNINFRSSEFRKDIERLDKNKPVLIYCLAGPRSKSAMNLFREAGFKTVYELNGGINAWSRAGKPIEQDLSGKGELASKSYDSIVSSPGLVLVDFYAPWCGPCRRMLPMLEDLANTYPGKFQLLKINFDQNRLLAKEKNIRSVPYLIIFENGKKIWEKSSEASREELMEVLKLRIEN
jgi:thioredoxin